MIQTLCYLLETLLTPENTPPDTAKEIYELYFVFAAVWAFGGFLFKDEVANETRSNLYTNVCVARICHPTSEIPINPKLGVWLFFSSWLIIVWSSPSGG